MTESAAKKPHWTQRPENKEKLKTMLKRAAKRKKAKKVAQRKPTPQSKTDAEFPEEVFAYALGYVECWIEAFAKSAGVPSETLASRMGKVLHGKNGR